MLHLIIWAAGTLGVHDLWFGGVPWWGDAIVTVLLAAVLSAIIWETTNPRID